MLRLCEKKNVMPGRKREHATFNKSITWKSCGLLERILRVFFPLVMRLASWASFVPLGTVGVIPPTGPSKPSS